MQLHLSSQFCACTSWFCSSSLRKSFKTTSTWVNCKQNKFPVMKDTSTSFLNISPRVREKTSRLRMTHSSALHPTDGRPSKYTRKGIWQRESSIDNQSLFIYGIFSNNCKKICTLLVTLLLYLNSNFETVDIISLKLFWGSNDFLNLSFPKPNKWAE